MGLFEKILDDAIKSPKKEPFSYYGLQSLEVKSPVELEKFFVNFESELGQLLNQILSISPEKPTVRIALIGPSGSGKTTLLEYLNFKLSQLREEPKYKDSLEKIRFILPLFTKGLPKDLIEIELDICKKNMGAGLIIDDIHEIFINEEPKLIESCFELLKGETKNNIVITTWLPYGWAYALSKHPEIKNMFDKVIFVKGLSKEHCKSLIEKRFRYSSRYNENIESSQKTIYKPFTDAAIEKIAELGCPNPRIIISLINEALSFAFKTELSEITEREIEIIRSNLGYDLDVDNLTPTQKKIIQICLVSTSLYTKEIEALSKIERANISMYMNDLVVKGFFTKKDYKRKKSQKVETLFRMVPFVRYKIESKTMEEVELSFQKK